jgi:hypothetical protein
MLDIEVAASIASDATIAMYFARAESVAPVVGSPYDSGAFSAQSTGICEWPKCIA